MKTINVTVYSHIRQGDVAQVQMVGEGNGPLDTCQVLMPFAEATNYPVGTKFTVTINKAG